MSYLLIIIVLATVYVVNLPASLLAKTRLRGFSLNHRTGQKINIFVSTDLHVESKLLRASMPR